MTPARKRRPVANILMGVITALILVVLALMVAVIVTGVDRWV